MAAAACEASKSVARAWSPDFNHSDRERYGCHPQIPVLTVAWSPRPFLIFTGRLADDEKFELAHHCYNVHCTRPFFGTPL